MPNWAEGSLKLRGRSENIASALKQMLLNDTVTLEDEWDGTLLKFNNTAPYFYINETRRAFIEQEQIEVWLEEEFCIVELDNFKQAWSVIPENYQEISSKFDIDIKIFTFECGMEFTQEIEISKGEIIKNVCYEYDNYQWEVPYDDIEYFLDEIAEYDMQEAELIEDFVRFQNYLLMYGIGFTLKNADEVKP